MTTTKSTSLRKLLAEAYPPEGKNAPDQFRIDDRSNDVYPEFCNIYVVVPESDPTRIILSLDHPPYDAEVEAVAEEMNGEWLTTPRWRRLTLSLAAHEFKSIRLLAKAIRQVTGRDKKYADRNWKWIAPRTAKSLERLAKVLSQFKNGKPNGRKSSPKSSPTIPRSNITPTRRETRA